MLQPVGEYATREVKVAHLAVLVSVLRLGHHPHRHRMCGGQRRRLGVRQRRRLEGVVFAPEQENVLGDALAAQRV